jgi:hypothetical protein
MNHTLEADTPAAGLALQCPYPNCPGTLPASSGDELAVCPDCQRLSARCPRLGKGGRCPTLNRSLARYCRHCRQELGPGWAQALWARDLSARRTAGLMGPAVPVPLRLTPALQEASQAERVLCLDGYAEFDRWDYRPLHLAEAGGRLWLGAPDGRTLLVEPFHDRNRTPPVVSEPLWPGAARVRPRARASGLWLTASSEHGIKALNLLTLEDPGGTGETFLELWAPEAGERLLADAVLLRDSRNGLERVAVWLTAGPAGVTLWAAPLLVTYGRLPPPRRFALEESGRPLTLEDSGRYVLTEAALAERDAALLAGAPGVWLLDVAAAVRGSTPAASADGRRPLAALPLLSGRNFLVSGGELPGVAFLPGGGTGKDEVCGTVFAAAAGALPGGPDELCAALVSPQGAAGHFACPGQGGIPLADVALGRGRGVLCRAGRSLLLCNPLGQLHRLATSDALPWVLRAHAYGRVAVCSGRDAAEGRGRWFVQLWDLEDDDTLIDQAFTDQLPTHPLLLGRYLFGVEMLGEPGKQALWLTRRQFG